MNVHSKTKNKQLGDFLKARRSKIDPATMGFGSTRRRTPGLRREEVALRANVSTTWYTWLEQGRGGAPSEDVLNKISEAMRLTDAEREHVFFLAFNRPPASKASDGEEVVPRLQKVLDAFESSPAMIRSSTWDVVAWNRAAEVVFIPYGDVPAENRNALRLMFLDPFMREVQLDWRMVAQYAVAAFRADVARAGIDASAFVAEMCELSEEFKVMWNDNNVQAHGGGPKTLRHPKVGLLNLEHSSFPIESRADLTMVVFCPASAEEKAKITSLLQAATDQR